MRRIEKKRTVAHSGVGRMPGFSSPRLVSLISLEMKKNEKNLVNDLWVARHQLAT